MILAIIILSFLAIRPVFSPGFWPIHDFQHIARLFELNKTLLSGIFPVRWVPDLGFGYGYALFNFYPPLVYYLGEIFHLLGASFLEATKIVWGLALVGSAVAMYFLAKTLFGKTAGLVAATFYLYAPYHAVDAYVRGALAELFSFVWLPLILLFSYQTNKTHKTYYSFLTGFFLALLMLTHNLVFLPFFGLFTLWYFANTLIFRKNLVNSCILYLVSCIVGFGLSAFFWLPALAEKQFTLTDQFLTTGLASYQIHFVCPVQLWSSPWGFGGSGANCVAGISFMIGKIHLVLAGVAIIAGAFLFFRRKLQPTTYYVLLTVLALLGFSIFMTLEGSKPIWSFIQPLWYLQFPWRFLEFVALFISLLAGSAIFLLPSKPLKILLSIILVSLLLVVEGKYFQPQFHQKVSDADLLTDYQIKWIVSGTSFEYMTKGVAVKRLASGGPILDILPSQVGQPGYHISSGDFKQTQFFFRPDRFLLVGESVKGANLTFSINNFPGWQADIDGFPTAISDENRLKLITVNFPPGLHRLRVNFNNTPVRTAGNAISFVSLIMLFVGLLYGSAIRTRGN